MKNLDSCDLQLFNLSLGGVRQYQIPILLMQKDAEIQIALFQLFVRGPTLLLGRENDQKKKIILFF